MKNKKTLVIVVIILFVVLIIAAIFSILRAFRNIDAAKPSSANVVAGKDNTSGDPGGTNASASEQTDVTGKDSDSESEDTTGEETLPDWVPFVVDTSEESPLEGFLYEGLPVQPASMLELAESGNREGLILAKVKEQAPDYPFDEIPLLRPDMLVTGSQRAVGDDVAVDILYYTLSSPDETLAFYRKELGKHEKFSEEVYESSTGNSYSMSFTVPGEYKKNASVMVMEMPQTTGYSCAVNIHIAIRGLNKKEEIVIQIRDDGLPGNFPDELVPIYKLQEIFYADGYSDGESDSCYVQFYSTASYRESVDFYRKELSGRAGFKEYDDTGTEISFRFNAPGWTVDIRIMDNEGRNSYLEINCYQQ